MNPIGKQGEDAAAAYLQKQGYHILVRNYHCRFGELDIVAVQDAILAFVEVKTRAHGRFGSPAESVDVYKQHKMIKSAYHFLSAHPNPLQPRFDVMEVYLSGASIKIRHLEHAFDLEGFDASF